VQPVNNSDLIVTYLLDQDGIHYNGATRIPVNFNSFSSASGTAKFSPDGNYYSMFSAYDNLLLFDFDREEGLLSNLRQQDVVDVSAPEIRFSSLEWSPNSRFIYVASSIELWQIDTWENDLSEGLELIDVWDGTQDPFATTFVLQALAPDCKIYITPGSGSNSYHVINAPNEKGQDCNFVQRGVKLPFTSARSTLPNFPRFRVDEEDKCDPTITSIFGDQVYYRKDLMAYPNPATNFINIEIPDNHSGQIFIFNMFGQLVYSQQTNGDYDFKIDLNFLNQGTYNVEFIPDNNIDRLVWTKQIVKVD